MVLGTNSTGWTELMNGQIVKAPWVMYSASNALGSWAIIILFCVFQFMLWMKTKNATLMFVMGVFFASLYSGIGIFGFVMNAQSNTIMYIILAIELAAILFVWLLK
jgi:hypothetical protein